MEPNFPRGGKEKLTAAAAAEISQKRKQNEDLFGKAADKKSSKKSKSSKKKEKVDEIDLSGKLRVAEPLTYKVLSEGMLVLGCVREIHHFYLNVSLPGRATGRVPISNISKQYSEALGASDDVPALEEIFYVGQHVVTKIMSIAVEGNYYQLTLSLCPDDINSEVAQSSVKEGIVLTGALSSIEDHGYLIDFGIGNTRAFLKTKQAEEFKETYNCKELAVGQLIRCLVTKAKSSTVEVTVNPARVNEALIPPSVGMNPHLVVPGMKFEVTSIQKIVHGAAIKWHKYDGYIHDDYFPNPNKTFESQFSNMDSISATVLYTMPLVRTVYFTLQEPTPFAIENRDPSLVANGVPSNSNIAIGEVIENAQVIYAGFRGICLKLKKGKIRGFVSLSQMPKLEDEETLRKKYPENTKVQCRVLSYDLMDRVFVCTMRKEKINEKLLTVNDIKPGSFVQCLIVDVRKNELFLEICKHPNLKARVQSIHLSDAHITDITKRFSAGQQIRGRALCVDKEKNILMITLKPSLVQSTKPILSDYTDIPLDKFFEGVVFYINTKFYLVSFYNGVTGKLSISDIPSDLNLNYNLGQTINVRVAKVLPGQKLKLTMEGCEEYTDVTFEVGREYNATVETVLGTEIKLKISANDSNGYGIVPRTLVSAHESLADSLMTSFTPGDQIKATCLCNTKENSIFTIDPELTKILKTGMEDEMYRFSLLPGLVKSIGRTGVVIRTLSKASEGSKVVFAFQRALADEPIENMRSAFAENQAVLFRVESVVTETRDQKEPIQATGSTRLMDVCPYGIEVGGFEFADNYMKTYFQIHKKFKKDKNLLVSYEPGQMVNAKIKSIHAGLAEVQLDGGVVGFISSYHSHGTALQVGQEVHAVVIWVDLGSQCVQLSTRPDILKQIHKDQASCPKPKFESTQRGEIIFIDDDVAVAIMKGQCRGLVVCVPVKKHINDLTPISYALGDTCKFVVKSLNGLLPVCVNKRDLPNKGKKPKALPGSLEWKMQKFDSKEAKKRQIEIKQEVDSDMEVDEILVKRLKTDEELEEDRKVLDVPDDIEEVTELAVEGIQVVKKNQVHKKGEPQTLQVAESPRDEIQVVKKKAQKKGEPQTLQVDSFVWDPNTVKPEDENSSSDESDTEEAPKKKLTLAERRAKARKEEEMLVKAEHKLMDEEQTPQSVDEFDRLLMATPDSSIVWVQYMAFHLQATEIEKARAVARKAIKTISFREEQEKLNVWVALLNLENLYGTPESLEKTLQEAVQLNDAQKVYAQMLKIFTDTNKLEEGNSLFDTMLRKYRSDKETWVQGGTFYFLTNQVEKGRHLLQRALRSLENRDHVDVICRFAHLENKHGSPERCHTLFEHILTTYPKRTDIWSSYVDLLVKAGNAEAARSVLDRAIQQKLPVRKMKVIFKKYLDFAQQHGNDDEVAAVKEKAQQFVQSVASNLPLDDDSD